MTTRETVPRNTAHLRCNIAQIAAAGSNIAHFSPRRTSYSSCPFAKTRRLDAAGQFDRPRKMTGTHIRGDRLRKSVICGMRQPLAASPSQLFPLLSADEWSRRAQRAGAKQTDICEQPSFQCLALPGDSKRCGVDLQKAVRVGQRLVAPRPLCSRGVICTEWRSNQLGRFSTVFLYGSVQSCKCDGMSQVLSAIVLLMPRTKTLLQHEMR
jgi:hypothetical protein